MVYVYVVYNCIVEDFVVIVNVVFLVGYVKIEFKVVIGGVLGIYQFVYVGKMVMVGGMGKVVRDVLFFMLVEGNFCLVRLFNLVGLKCVGVISVDLVILKKVFWIFYCEDKFFSEVLNEL